MRYTLDKEELEQLKTKLLVNVDDFIKQVVEFREKPSPWADVSGWDSRTAPGRTVTISSNKFSELVEKLRDDVSETIRNL